MFGQRLKEERKRVGFTQPQLGEVVSLTKRTVIDWEKDKSSPTAIQLAAMAKNGFDVSYLITGIRTQPVELPSDEALLLDSYRALDAEQKKMTLRFLLGGLEHLKNDENDDDDANSGNADSNNKNSNNTNSNNENSNNVDSNNTGSNNTNSNNSNVLNSFNTQSGFTELPFIWACAVCGAMAWLLGAVASWKAATDVMVSMSFGSIALLLWVVSVVMAVFGYHAGKAKYDETQDKLAAG